MKTIKGPGLFLAQFLSAEPPYDTLDSIAGWAASIGYKAVQLPADNPRCIDLDKAAASQDYCDDLRATLDRHGLVISELSTHIFGQLMAVHPAYDVMMDVLAPAGMRGRPAARREWAEQRMRLAARASRRLGLSKSVSFSGALLWPFVYPWPQRPSGLVDDGFAELTGRWRPILDAYDEAGVDICFELHPGEDLHDGATFDRFLDGVDMHPRANILYDPSHLLLQQMDYVGFIDRYADRIKAFHVKDAEFRPDARSGLYGGYQSWVDRPGRFRSLGDGQIDFRQIFSKLALFYDGWAVVEWECALKDGTCGAAESAQAVRQLIIQTTDKAFDTFTGGGGMDHERNRAILGLD